MLLKNTNISLSYNDKNDKNGCHKLKYYYKYISNIMIDQFNVIYDSI